MNNKFFYYTKLALKKPWLIKDALYKQHLGVIVLAPIRMNAEKFDMNDKVRVCRCNDTLKILEFYSAMGRSFVTKNSIEKWLEKGYDCFTAYIDEEIVASMWVFKNTFEVHNLSGMVLSQNKVINLDEDTLYGNLVIVDPNFRGKKLSEIMIGEVINYYASDNVYKNLVEIIGADNTASIKSILKFKGEIIGIVKVTNILGKIKRHQYFLNENKKCWNN